MITKSDDNINCPIMRCLKLGSVLLCAPGCCRKFGYHSSTKELLSSNKLNYSVYKIILTASTEL